jgi:tetraprenyl-beta-curcumene synthase
MLATLRTIRTLTQYESSIVPYARREIDRWADVAAAIPDPALRGQATAALAADASNAEAAAAFAAFAPRRLRSATIELLVAWQVLIDYIDALGERADVDPLAHGLELGIALTATITGQPSPPNLETLADDGGYLATLVATCHDRLHLFPSAASVQQPAAAAATRCAHALAHTHAAAQTGTTTQLRNWASRQTPMHAYEWWEIAAGANSNIAVLALLAAAADPATTPRHAEDIATAYWPHICALSTLLDSLVDYERDAGTGNFSFVAHYPDEAAAQRGLVNAAKCSLDATSTLHQSHTHAMIVCGVAAFYGTAANAGLAAQLAPSLLAALRPTITPIVVALRAQRRVGGSAP